MIYWISTILICSFLAWSAASYLFHAPSIASVRDVGFPDFFRYELVVLKAIAIFILIIPSIPIEIKEWAYAGVAFFFLTATIAHLAHKDSFLFTFANVILLALLGASRYYMQ